MTRKSNDNFFIQEYLYIEEYPLHIIDEEIYNAQKKKTDECQRGVEVIDLLGNEED